MIRNRELQIILQDLENFIQTIRCIPFEEKTNQIHNWCSSERRAVSHWDQDWRYSVRFPSHLSDELRPSRSKTPGTSMFYAQNIKEKTLCVKENNGVRSGLFKLGSSTLKKSDLKLDTDQQMIQHDCRSIHFRKCFYLIFVIQISLSQSVQTFKVDVLLDVDTQLQELSFQEVVRTHPCHRNRGLGLYKRQIKMILLGRRIKKWWTRVSRMENIWKMIQHSTDGVTSQEIWRWLESQSSSRWKDRSSLLNLGSEEDRIWMSLFVLLFATTCVLVFSLWQFRLRRAPWSVTINRPKVTTLRGRVPQKILVRSVMTCIIIVNV